MENFVVSARKYRPATFESVVGQNAITSTLKNAIRNNQLAQAFLFTGPRGVGKTTCARIMAKTINCKNLTESIEPCNICDSCLAFNTSASFNVHELDAASNNSVEDIRSLVEQVRIPPQSVQYKVYIIDEVHMLSQQAFNAFLKTLEEPPAYAKFILATTEKHKIIPTILSRCQIYDFNRITVEDIAKHLVYIATQENIKAETEGLELIAQKADGSLRDALSIFDQISTFSGNNITYNDVLENLNVVDAKTYFEVTDYILGNNIANILLLLNDIVEQGHDGHHFIMGLGEHFRNLLVCKDPATIKLMQTIPAYNDMFLSQSQRCTAEFLISSLDIINKCDLNYKVAGNKRLLIELSVIQISKLLAAKIESVPVAVPQKTPSPPPVMPTKTIKSEETKITENIKKEELKKPEEKELSKGAFSISTMMSNSYKKEDKQELPEAKEEDDIADFSEEDLQKVWEVFGNTMVNDNPPFQVIIQSIIPKKNKPNTISINVGSELSKRTFAEHKSTLADYLRKELSVKNIEIEINIVKGEEIKVSKPITAKEKYAKMNEKNNNLNTLINKLDLEFDY